MITSLSSTQFFLAHDHTKPPRRGKKLLPKISVTILQTLEQNREPGPQATERHCKVKIWVIVFWVILSKTLISSDMVTELSFVYIGFFEMLPATLFIFLILV